MCHVALTPKGEDLLRQCGPTHWHGVREHFLSRLNEQDMRALGHVWNKLEGAPITQAVPR